MSTPNVAGKEIFQRVNYLYQASKHVSEITLNTEHMELKKCMDFISHYYSNLMMKVAKKSVLRVDSNIKRSICKGCGCLLIPGATATVRLRKKPCKNVRCTCKICGTVRILNTKKDYRLWSETPEAVVQVLDYNINN